LGGGRRLYSFVASTLTYFDPLGLVACGTKNLYHSTDPAAIAPISKTGFDINRPNAKAAFHNNRFGRGVYLSHSPSAALAERPGGAVVLVNANLGNNLDITSRGPIRDKALAKSIARGARKHGFNSLTTESVQPGGGINTVVFNPADAVLIGPI
jgi:hypothetical protein